MRKVLLDVLKHVGAASSIDTAKITSNDDLTYIEAMDNDRTLFIKGTLKEPSKDLEGEFGISYFPLLTGLLNHTSYKSDDANIELVREERDGELTPIEMSFTNSQGKNKALFRFTHKKYVPTQPKFKAPAWDIEINPAKSILNEFAATASIYSAFETFFNVIVDDGEVRFAIGDATSSSHKVEVTIDQENKKAKSIGSELYWDIPTVLSVLKLGQNDENLTMKFTSKGVLEIDFTSEFATWEFILPARKK